MCEIRGLQDLACAKGRHQFLGEVKGGKQFFGKAKGGQAFLKNHFGNSPPPPVHKINASPLKRLLEKP
jgi:hypothetical protein